MKKFLTLSLSALLCTALLVPAGATSWITTDTVSQMDEYPDWVDGAEVLEFEDFDDGTTDSNSSEGMGFTYVYLKQKGLGDLVSTFKVDKAGTYNIGVRLMAWCKSVPRSTEFKIDDSEWIYICYDYNDEDQYSEQYVTGPTVYLEAGDHTVTLSLADDFDDTTVKSLYFDSFLYAFASEDKPAEPAAEEPAPEPEEPVAEPVVEEPAPVAAEEPEVVAEPIAEPEAPSTEPDVVPEPSPAPVEEFVISDGTPLAPEGFNERAPQTFDFGVISAIAAVLSLAGVAVAKKK